MAHLIFETVRWKNIFSYGDTWTEIQLNRNDSTLVEGKNGSGKSAFFEALHIGLFGVTIRGVKKKAKIVNERNNKDGAIEIVLKTKGIRYKIIRTFKPDSLTVEKDGTPIRELSSLRQTQKYINQDILGGDKTAFQITTQISKSGINMFMDLKSEDRRKFIDGILGTGVFTEMSKLHKANLDTKLTERDGTHLQAAKLEERVKGKADEIKTSTEAHKAFVAQWKSNKDEAVKNAQFYLETAESELTNIEPLKVRLKWVDQRRAEIDASIAEANTKIDVVTDDQDDEELSIRAELRKLTEAPRIEVDIKKSELGAHEKKLRVNENRLIEISSEMKSLLAMIENVKEGKCPTCLQDVDRKHIEREQEVVREALETLRMERSALTKENNGLLEKIGNLENELDTEKKIEKRISEYDSKLDSKKEMRAYKIKQLTDSIKKFEGERENLSMKVEEITEKFESDERKLRAKLESARVSLDERKREAIDEPPKNTQTTKLKSELKELLQQLDAVKHELGVLDNELAYLKLITQMLKEGGVKTVIIRRFLPIINKCVNDELAALGFHAKFKLDESFSETITYNGHEREFQQFSEGEKLRINVALILAWRKIAKLQGKMDSNLLMMDETLGESLDVDGYEALGEIFKRLEDLNVFIITHSPEKVENFIRSKIRFHRAGGFSKIIANA